MANHKLELTPTDTGLKLVTAFLGPKVVDTDVEVTSVQAELSKLTLASGESFEGTDALALYLCENSGQSDLLGANDVEKAQIHQWLQSSSRNRAASDRTQFAQEANQQLASETYLINNKLSLADLVAFANIHAWIASLSKPKRITFCNLVRWFDLIQHTLPAEALKQAGLELVPIDLDAPSEVTAAGAAKPAGSAEAGAGVKDKKKKKEKEKKEKKPSNEPKPITPSQLDLRVGHIVDCQKHPDADSLYVEKIDAGEEELRTVVSGLVKFIPLEEMQNRNVVLLCNLKPANMRGIKSHAMVLAATSPDGNTVELIDPPAGAKPGQKVYFEDFKEGEPEAVLNPKKKIWETIQPGLFTDDTCQALFKDAEDKVHLLKTDDGVCKVHSVVQATIK
ncbi:G4 quadruplex nucleic acid binding protein [Dimargaris verticillata]|uniref:G4 quadruplex nucleic acid binding protein n=1 Tax=Dimargaris verticillata TaxID=2761393 RepID=A0A9W8AWK4_9FUNG|nr:G4 quadruplex nucleic acid binding protein [Dimargaris verticillata]